MSKDKKKNKKKPLRPKVNIDAHLPPPGPVKWARPSNILEKAREYPIMGCWVISGWQEAGLTPVVVARQQTPEKILFATVLVDIFCLGVKDAFWKADISLKQFQRKLPEMLMGEPEFCEADLAHEIIYGAIQFADRYGFQPHPDFKQTSLILDPPGAHPMRRRVEFGQNGKPLFVSGPYDNVPEIIEKLNRTAGMGNFDYLVRFSDNS